MEPPLAETALETRGPTTSANTAKKRPVSFDCGNCGGGGSSAFSSLESLADMTVCAVHYGRMDRPKLLPCGHVFCLACLDKWSEQQGGLHIECPMCRRRYPRPEHGAADLPTARAHQAILEYLVAHAVKRVATCQQQQKVGTEEAQPPRRQRSLEMRQDLLAQLSDDLVRRADSAAPEAFNREELAGVRDNLSRVLQRLDDAATARRPVEAVEAVEGDDDGDENQNEESGEFSDSYEDDGEAGAAHSDPLTVAIEDAGADDTAAATADAFAATQREMHRLSRYRVRELSVDWNPEANESGGKIAGAGLLGGQSPGNSRRTTLVLLSGRSRCLIVQRSRGSRRSTRLARLSFDEQLPAWLDPVPAASAGAEGIDGGVSNSSPGDHRLRVASMQSARGFVYISGWVGRRSLLAIISLEGAGTAGGSGVMRCHAREEASESEAALGFAGFHVEPSGLAKVVAAQPGRQRVEFFSEELHPTGHWLVFDRLTPRHVAWVSQLETLWVSCPDQRLVLAVNDSTGVYRKLSTSDIFASPPAHIVAGRTPDGDCRVVLADSEQGRLYWIRKRRKYIFLQRLQLPYELPGITSLSPMENGQLLVTSQDSLFLLKPASRRATQGMKCSLL